MARLQTVLDEVQTSITALFGTVKYRTGHKYLQDKWPNPRIVWVPGKDLYEATRDGRHSRPRSVKTRRCAVTAYCFHDDFGACEELINWVVVALHTSVSGSFEVEEGVWSQPEWLEKGYLCELSFLVDVPVTDVMPTLTTPTAITFDTSTTVQADGLLDAGEST